MNIKEILGEPSFIGEIRIIKESPIPKRLAKSVAEWFPERTLYFKSSSSGTWFLLYEHEVEELHRNGKL